MQPHQKLLKILLVLDSEIIIKLEALGHTCACRLILWLFVILLCYLLFN